jgi:hypothetical protein
MKQILLIMLTLSFYYINASDWVLRSNVPGETIGLQCLDSNNCYTLSLAGFLAYIMRSSNQGLTWDTLHKFDAWEEYAKGEPYTTNATDLIVIDTNNFFITYLEEVPYFKKSTDGGKTFHEYGIEGAVDSFFINKFSMYNELVGFARVGQESFITFDGWITNNQVDLDNYLKSDGNYQGIFLDSLNMMFCIIDTSFATSNLVDFIIKYNIRDDNFQILHTIQEETPFFPTKFEKVNEQGTNDGGCKKSVVL